MVLSDGSLPRTISQDISQQYDNISSTYYILFGDNYCPFAIIHPLDNYVQLHR